MVFLLKVKVEGDFINSMQQANLEIAESELLQFLAQKKGLQIGTDNFENTAFLCFIFHKLT